MSDTNSISVSISRTVRPGCEHEFEQQLHEFVRRSLSLPGQLGVHIMRPPNGSESREYGIVRKFCNRQALDAFRKSSEYRAWQESVASLTEGEARTEELTGLESWFTLPGHPLLPLPKWKMAVSTFIGVFPVATVLNLSIGPRMRSWPFLLSNMVFNACVVAILTWLVMPVVSKLLRNWLHHGERRSPS